MAPFTDHNRPDLATRLEEHADGIDNLDHHGLEMDLRDAAKALREHGAPMALLPRLAAEINRACAHTTDSATRMILRGVIGEAP
jgi:hypothetical protein